jgi:hypothetical protein
MASKKSPLRVALYGMDSRAAKILTLFLHGPCGDAAVVVNTDEADVDIIDGDAPISKSLIEKHFQEHALRPVIILSLWDVVQEGVLHVKKPVNTENMIKVLEQAKKLIGKVPKRTVEITNPSTPQVAEQDMLELLNYALMPSQEALAKQNEIESQTVKKPINDKDEHGSTAKQKKPMLPAQSETQIAYVEDPLQHVDDWFESGL